MLRNMLQKIVARPGTAGAIRRRQLSPPPLASNSIFTPPEDYVKRSVTLGILAGLLLAAASAHAQHSSYGSSQQFDVGFGVGTLLAPSTATTSANHNQSLGGGTYLSFSGDYLFWHHLGVEGEVSWRASQGYYFAIQPYRPILYDFNAIYAPPLGKYVQLELLAGIGALSTRFYTPNYFCSFYYCINYYSSNHFDGDVGVGLRIYAYKGLFIRPEYRQYFIHNNYEFNSAYAGRAGGTIGYSFGR